MIATAHKCHRCAKEQECILVHFNRGAPGWALQFTMLTAREPAVIARAWL